MTVSPEMRAKAFEVKYHQRKALQFIARGQAHRVSERMMAALVKAGLVLDGSEPSGAVNLSESGQELHDTLEALGWFPPDKGEVPPDGSLGKGSNPRQDQRA